MFADTVLALGTTAADLETLGLAGLAAFIVIVAVKYGKAILS